MAKSPDAFRTISEVADWLGVQAHVLRFWESKFAQVKPIKRAGGRRYYRPSDMLLLGGLKRVLHEDGMTIKGAQKLLREKGVGYVADMSQPLDDLTIAVIEGSSEPVTAEDSLPNVDIEVAEPEIVAEPELQQKAIEAEQEDAAFPPEFNVSEAEAEETLQDLHASDDTSDDAVSAGAPSEIDEQHDLPLEATNEAPPSPEPEQQEAEPAPMVSFRARPRDVPSAPPPETDATPAELPTEAEPDPEQAPLEAEEDTPAPVEATPKPQRVDVTLVHDHTTIKVDPSALSALSQIRSLSPEHATDIRPLLARLTRLRASMANPRKEQRKD